MHILKTLTFALLLPLFAGAALAADADTDATKPPAKPTLTYYFFDG